MYPEVTRRSSLTVFNLIWRSSCLWFLYCLAIDPVCVSVKRIVVNYLAFLLPSFFFFNCKYFYFGVNHKFSGSRPMGVSVFFFVFFTSVSLKGHLAFVWFCQLMHGGINLFLHDWCNFWFVGLIWQGVDLNFMVGS